MAKMQAPHIDLSSAAQTMLSMLSEAVTNPAHPFRSPILATTDGAKPHARTVVLRSVDDAARVLECHTDRRSAKMQHLRDHPSLCWTFYDPASRVQIVAHGNASLHFDDDHAERRWASLSVHQQRGFAQVLPPGQRVERIEGAAPCPGADANAGRQNFTVVRSVVDSLEWLSLHRDGHVRAMARFAGERWSAQWIMP